MLLDRRADREYLRLEGEEEGFALRDLAAPFLLVEVYNELCFTCQEELPTFNLLFRAIEADRELRGRLKMIGLGAGSTPRAVVKFRRRKEVLFPLFADHHREIFDCLGRPELPVVYLLRREAESGFRIVMTHSGHVKSAAGLLDGIRKAMAGRAALQSGD